MEKLRSFSIFHIRLLRNDWSLGELYDPLGIIMFFDEVLRLV